MADTKKTLMSQEHKQTLEKHLSELVENMTLGPIFWATLIQEEVFTSTEQQQIEGENVTDPGRTLAVVQLLQRKPDDAFCKFIGALNKTNQPHLANILAGKKRKCEELDDVKPSTSSPKHHRGDTGVRPLRYVGPWQADVAKHYQRYNNHIPVCPYGPYKKHVNLDQLYIQPTCSVSQRELGTEAKDVDVRSLFHNTGDLSRTFLIGSPGMGKSTVVNWGLSSWAKQILDKAKVENTSDESQVPSADDFMYDLIICVFLRYVKLGATLQETIRDQIWCDCLTEVTEFIKTNPSRVLFICDGLDEYNPDTSSDITSFLEGKLLPKVSRIVTSRHTQADSPSAKLVQFYEKQAELNGFDESRISEYISRYKMMSNAKVSSASVPSTSKKPPPDALYENIKSANMISLCGTPLHLCFMCQMAEAGAKLSKTTTPLYIQFIKYTLDVNKSKLARPESNNLDNLDPYHEELVDCGTAALALFIGEQGRFSLTRSPGNINQNAHIIEKGTQHGLIIPVQPEHLGDKKLYTFIHLSVQEFVASYAVVHNKAQRQLFISYLTNIFRLHDCRSVISFCCGMSEQCGNELLSHAVRLVRNSKENPTAHQCPYFNPVAWHSGKVGWLAETTMSRDISYFVAQCVAEYEHQDRCDIPLPADITLDLSQPETNAILTMFRHNKSKSQVGFISIKNGDLSRDIWETTTSVILPHELTHLSLILNYIEDTAALAASLNQMKNLTRLGLKIQSLTETDCERTLAAIPQTTPLVSLCLRYFRLSLRGADLLSELTGTLKHLVTLRVSDTELSRLGPRVTSLVTSQHLARLGINNTHVTRQQMTSLCAALPGKCPRLLWLVMDGNDISGVEDRVAEAVSNLNHLSWLTISNCNITSQGLWQILQSLPDSLRLLNICNNGFTHFSRLSESSHILHLRSLRFLWCQSTAVPAEVMQRLVRSCKQTLPDLILMYDHKSYKAGKQALEAFNVEQSNEILAREYSVNRR